MAIQHSQTRAIIFCPVPHRIGLTHIGSHVCSFNAIRRLDPLKPQVSYSLVEQLEFFDVAVAVVGGGEGVGAVAFEGEEVGGEGAEGARAVLVFAEGASAIVLVPYLRGVPPRETA